MGERYFTRPPERLDIDLTGDGHGHHIAGTPYVFRHGWKLINGTPKSNPKHKLEVTAKLTTKTGEVNTADRGVMRHLKEVTAEVQADLFRKNGLTTHFDASLSVTELHERWKESDDPDEKAKLLHDIEVHVKTAHLVLGSMERDLLDAKRDEKRQALSKFDERLAKNAIGRGVLKIRDKMVSDKMLDHWTDFKEQVQEHGFEWAKHAATGAAAAALIGHLLGPVLLVPLAQHFGGEGAKILVEHLLESPAAETGVAAFVALHLTKRAFAPLEKLVGHEKRVEKAKKALETQAKKKVATA